MDNIHGFPRVIAKDKNTGEVLWEKTYKNTGYVGWNYFANPFKHRFLATICDGGYMPIIYNQGAGGIAAAVPMGDTFESEFNGFKIAYSSTGAGRVSRFTGGNSLPSNYGLSNVDTTLIKDTTIPVGSLKISKVERTGPTRYIEVYGRIEAPPIVNIINSIYVMDETAYGGDSYRNYCGVDLDEEIQQDSNTILEIYYRIIFPERSDSRSAAILSKLPFGTALYTGIDEENPVALLKQCYRRVGNRTVTMLYASDVSNLSDKYTGPSHAFESKYSKYTHITDFMYANNTTYNIRGGQSTFHTEYNISSIAQTVGSLIGSFNSIFSSSTISDYQNKLFYLNSDKDIKSNYKSLKQEYPINVNVFSKRPNSSAIYRPFADTANLATGSAEISAKLLKKYDSHPEYWTIDITKSGVIGTAKAKITKSPFLGSPGNVMCGGYMSLPLYSSSFIDAGTYDASAMNGIFTMSKKSSLNRDDGYRYINAGQRIALFDGHFLIVIRDGVLIAHTSINDYEVYNKDSSPALPISSMTSVTYNNLTKDIFIGCSETGLWKINKSLRNSNPASIQKISGPQRIYTMSSDNKGKMTIVSERGIEFSIDNGATWETRPLSDFSTLTIDTVKKLTWINAIATDYDSPNFNTICLYNSYKTRSNIPGFKYSKGAGSTEFTFNQVSGRNITHRERDGKIFNPFLLENILDKQRLYEIFKEGGPTHILANNSWGISVDGTSIGRDKYHYIAWRQSVSINYLPNTFFSFRNGKFVLSAGNGIANFDFPTSNTVTYSMVMTATGGASQTDSDYSDTDGSGYVSAKSFVSGSKTVYPAIKPFNGLYGDTPILKSYTRQQSPYANISLSSEIVTRDWCVSSYIDGTSYKWLSALPTRSNLAMHADVFDDSGLMLITNIHPSIGMTGSSWDFYKEPAYSTYFKDNILPTESNTNDGRWSFSETVLWDYSKEYGTNDSPIKDVLFKNVPVNGEEEFTISSNSLTVDGVELTFTENSGFEQGDQYSFVNYDGIVDDGSTRWSISADFGHGEYSDRIVSKTGVIGAQNNIDTPVTSRISNSGNIGMTRNAVVSFGECSRGSIHFWKCIFGGFKYRLDLDKFSGAIAISNQFSYQQSTASVTILLFKLDGNIHIYPLVNNNFTTGTERHYVHLNSATLNTWKINHSDRIEVEFVPINGAVNVLKNGSQLYTTGRMSSGNVPACRISFGSFDLFKSLNDGSAIMRSNRSTVNESFSKQKDPLYCKFPIFEYEGKGLVGTTLGDKLERTCIYDERYMSMPRTVDGESLYIKIGDKVLKHEDLICHQILRAQTSDGFFPSQLLTFAMMSGETIPFNIPSGKVLQIPDLGLFIFSEEDIGKPYEIRTGWYKDIIFGIDEFEEESRFER